MKDFFKSVPLFGVRMPANNVLGRTVDSFTFQFDTPLIVHLFVSTIIALNIILWPLIGVIEAIKHF